MSAVLDVNTVSLINSGNRILNDSDDWKDLKISVLNTIDYLNHIKRQYDYFLPPLLKLDGVKEISGELTDVFKLQFETLNQIDDVSDKKNKDNLKELLIEIENNASKMIKLFARLRKKSLDHPVYSMIPVINDLLTVSIDCRDGLLPLEPLKLRLVNLVNFKRFIENQMNDFKKNFPDENKVLSLYATVIKNSENALAALNNYLESGEAERMNEVIILLKQVDKNFKACQASAEEAAMKRLDYPQVPAIQNMHWIMGEYRRENADTEAVLKGIKVLERMKEMESAELLLTETFTFIKQKIKEKYFPLLKENLRNQKKLLSSMKRNIDSPSKILASLEEFASFVNEFSDTTEEMKVEIKINPELSKIPPADQLLKGIKLVFQGEIPDSHLEKQINELTEYTDKLKSQLEAGKKDKKTKMILTSLSKETQLQNKGIRLLKKYLGEENRDYLSEAYSLIEESSTRIVPILEFLDEENENRKEEMI